MSISIRAGERLVVLGPSGSGKTTLLRLIAGLHEPQSGTVRIGARDMAGVPPHERDLAMVFQSQSLYPHLSVAANLAFSLRARRVPRAERRDRVREAAALLGLEDLLERRPSQLSGGERQRVALGRAVARRPGILLLDEPFAGLDEPLRVALRAELLDLHRRIGSTLVMVTHDQAEALAIGERLAVLDRGRLLQVGPPSEVYARPGHRLVASFLGRPGMNLLRCAVVQDGDSLRIVPDGTAPSCPIVPPDDRLPRPGRYELGIRAERVRILGPSGGHTGIGAGLILAPGVARTVEYRGESNLLAIGIGLQTLFVRVATDASPGEGQAVAAAFSLNDVCWFDPGSGLRVAGGGGPDA
ncbi:ABC transporter ATP-binding protein [Aquisphaera giovannonii]|uniref:ABC transporter ATP-binding protein n=1 Tax=Aquisphaera giovannonii TaxID=406548 RepID=UPI00143D69FB|nr:ABC transporter ATP-binding protein [Aquisphaera giovannonii]